MEDSRQNIALSVIVPCYNVEDYLDRSLGSLERQWNGRTDYEIILVNDASTDHTIDKLNDFKKRYPDNVIVIDKKINQGVGMARNSGLDAARGQWIAFMDPDDALKKQSYSSLLSLVERADIDVLSFGVNVVPEKEWDNSLIDDAFVGKIDEVESVKEFMKKRHFATCLSYLFRRDFIKKQRFPALMFLEDVLFVLPLFTSVATIGITSTKTYLYIVHQSSTTNLINSERLNRGCDDVVAALMMMNDIKKDKSPDIVKRITERQKFYTINLFTRLLLSGKNAKQLKSIKICLDDMKLLPFNGNDLKTRFYNFLFCHQHLMILSRPFYRLMRKQKK